MNQPYASYETLGPSVEPDSAKTLSTRCRHISIPAWLDVRSRDEPCGNQGFRQGDTDSIIIITDYLSQRHVTGCALPGLQVLHIGRSLVLQLLKKTRDLLVKVSCYPP